MAKETLMHRIVIPSRLPGINQWLTAMNANRYKGADMKRKAQAECEKAISDCLGGIKIERPVLIHYTWFEPNTRRDHDNISGFGHKVIQDALVSMGVLKDDGWDEIKGYTDAFLVDKNNPRIEVILEEL